MNKTVNQTTQFYMEVTILLFKISKIKFSTKI